MWTRIAIITAFVLGSVGIAHAQAPGGIEWNIAEYELEDTSGNNLGYLYVPGPKHAQAGESIWVWDGTPWGETFTMTYLGDVSSYSVPSGWTDEKFENGTLTSGAVPGGTLNYNWKVTGNSETTYVDYGATHMDWWSPDGISGLSQSAVYTFTKSTGTIPSSQVSTAIENDEL